MNEGKWNIRRKWQLAFLLSDYLTALLVWIAFLVFRWLVYEGRLFSVDNILIPIFGFYKPLILYPVFCCIIYYLSGFYMRLFKRTPWRDFMLSLFSSIVIALSAFFVIIIDDTIHSISNYYVSLITLFTLQFLLSFLGRVITSTALGAYNRLPKVYKLTADNVNAVLDGAPLLLPQGTESVVIEMPKGATEQSLFEIINKVYPYGIEIMFTARLYDMLLGSARLRDLNTQPMVSITDLPMSDSEMCIKRGFDIVAAILMLVLLSPLMVIIAIAVRLDSKGSVIYKQERIGHYGRPFHILKFRTMVADAEHEVPALTTDNDPRVTRIGRVLRKYRLDELPQLWNIVKGEMSVVGPRPERAYFINKIVSEAPYYCLIYKIRPGLTSWGPIRVGYTDTIEKMVQRLNYDIVYMESMSLLLDIKIMLKTISVLVDGKGK